MRKEEVGEQVKGQSHSDFPGGPMVKNPPVNAGDTGPTPGLGRVHMPQSDETHGHLEPALCSKRSQQSGKPANHSSRIAPACRN